MIISVGLMRSDGFREEWRGRRCKTVEVAEVELFSILDRY